MALNKVALLALASLTPPAASARKFGDFDGRSATSTGLPLAFVDVEGISRF